jgi:hypothetical protein
MSSWEGEFEKGLESTTFGDSLALSRELDEEHERLGKLYVEARSSEQRRL